LYSGLFSFNIHDIKSTDNKLWFEFDSLDGSLFTALACKSTTIYTAASIESSTLINSQCCSGACEHVTMLIVYWCADKEKIT